MKSFISGIIWILGCILGLVGAVFAFMATSIVVSNIIVLCLLSVIIGFLIIIGMGKLAQIVSKKSRNIKTPVVVASVAMIVFSLFAATTVFKPLPGPIMEAELPSNTKYWDLETGSKIAYWHYEAVGVKKLEPIIFLHGGPGVFTRDLERDFFSKFTKLGYDVYLYDQPGAGFSDTLPLENYTVDRYIQDLEAIRQEIGAEKVILVGQSFGGVLATAYAGEYPDKVENLILTSPGELNELTESEKENVAPNAGDSIETYTLSLSESLRIQVAMIMLNLNKSAAESFLTQEEITDYSTRMINELIAQSYPADYVDKIPKLKTGGINLYANALLRNDKAEQTQAIIDKNKENDVPVLILRTEYDYVPWPGTRYYRELYSNSHLVYIKDSGHIPWSINIEESYNTILEFITNKPLQLPDYTGNEDPAN